MQVRPTKRSSCGSSTKLYKRIQATQMLWEAWHEFQILALQVAQMTGNECQLLSQFGSLISPQKWNTYLDNRRWHCLHVVRTYFFRIQSFCTSQWWHCLFWRRPHSPNLERYVIHSFITSQLSAKYLPQRWRALSDHSPSCRVCLVSFYNAKRWYCERVQWWCRTSIQRARRSVGHDPGAEGLRRYFGESGVTKSADRGYK